LPFAFLLDLALLTPLIGYDLRTLHGRLHPATVRGIAVLVSSDAKLFALWGTALWHELMSAVVHLMNG
jgi:hypothetical protein